MPIFICVSDHVFAHSIRSSLGTGKMDELWLTESSRTRYSGFPGHIARGAVRKKFVNAAPPHRAAQGSLGFSDNHPPAPEHTPFGGYVRLIFCLYYFVVIVVQAQC